MTNTPPEVLEKWRKDFETENTIPNHIFWSGSEYDSKWPELTRADVQYNEYFNIWISSRQTAVIELPAHHIDHGYNDYWPGYNDGLRTAESAIESQGYQVKINETV